MVPPKKLIKNANNEKDGVLAKRIHGLVDEAPPQKRSTNEVILTNEEINRKIQENKKKQQEADANRAFDPSKIDILKRFAANK